MGFFDGVHLGHQSILDGADAAFTFRNHPLSVLAPDSAPRLIMDFESRVAAIRACGISNVMAFDFTLDFAKLSPDEFLAAAKITPDVRIRCGANWRFGRGGSGDAEYLRARGFDVEVVPYVSYKGDKVSSTRIRAAIERGEIEDANAMLGRPCEVVGSTFEGKGEGARLGFPTVNVALGEGSLKLPLGVYAADANGARAVANYGFAPTFGERSWHTPVMEVHFLGHMPETVQGQPLRIKLLRYIRPESRFASLDELKARMAVDCAEAAK